MDGAVALDAENAPLCLKPKHIGVDQDLTVADGTGYFFNAVVQLETTPIVGVAPSGIEVIRNR